MQTALHEKDVIISHLQCELANWPGRHLATSPGAQIFTPHLSSANRDQWEQPSTNNSSFSASRGGAESKPSHGASGQEERLAESARRSLRESMVEDGPGPGTSPVAGHEVEIHGQGLHSSRAEKSRSDYGSAREDPTAFSEADRAGTNPLSFSPYTRSTPENLDSGEEIFQGGFGDRGTASLSRRLRALTDSTANVGITEGTQERFFGAKSMSVSALGNNVRIVSSPLGLRSYGTPEARASSNSKYFAHSDAEQEFIHAPRPVPTHVRIEKRVSVSEDEINSDVGEEDRREICEQLDQLASEPGIKSGGAHEQVYSNDSSQVKHIRPTTAHPAREQRSRHELAAENAVPDELTTEEASLTSRSSSSISSVRRKKPLTPTGKVLFSERKKVASPAPNPSRGAVVGSNSRPVGGDGEREDVGGGREPSTASVPRKLRSTVIASRESITSIPPDADPYETDHFGAARVRTYQRPTDVNVLKKPRGTCERPTTARLSAERRRSEVRVGGEYGECVERDYHVQRQAFENELFRVLPLVENSD